MVNFKEHSHRRFSPLTREWLLVSPHRDQRPWQGQMEKVDPVRVSMYDPECFMCPGNARMGGERNPNYTSTFVFANDFSALEADTPLDAFNERDLLVAQGERGLCRVVCFSPRHDLTLARMAFKDIRTMVDLWVVQYEELAALPFIQWVQIFENRTAMMGASNPHPHCQIWASSSLPNEPAKEQATQSAYYLAHSRQLLADYLELESRHQERLVCSNDHFTALVPFWAIWPFETLVLSNRSVTALSELTGEERDGLADILKRLTTRYDNLFRFPFPIPWAFIKSRLTAHHTLSAGSIFTSIPRYCVPHP